MIFRRLISARLEQARSLAGAAVDGLDDRSRLFLAELAAERQRLLGLVVFALAGVLVTVVAVVWAAATVVAFSWDTPWRDTALVGLLVFWVVFAIALGLRVKGLLSAGRDAFRLTRQVASEDLQQLRETLRP